MGEFPINRATADSKRPADIHICLGRWTLREVGFNLPNDGGVAMDGCQDQRLEDHEPIQQEPFDQNSPPTAHVATEPGTAEIEE